MLETITKLKGKIDGPTSIILVGVHGNELCGVEALERILPNLEIEKGTVLFGYGNPRAIESGQRFVDANLNRMFKSDELLSKNEQESYEYKRAQFLKKYLDQADALLDVHASNTPKSTPFAICEPSAKKIVKYLPINLVVSGFDEVEPGGTDHYMNSIGGMGVCVECGYSKDPQTAKIARESIFAFLKARGHIENNIHSQKQFYIRMYELYVTETNNFKLSKQFDDFEEVADGQVIGIDGDKKVQLKKASVVLFARNREKIGEEAFLLGEKKNSLT